MADTLEEKNNEEKPILSPKTGAGLVCQKHTDIVITEFKNKFFIIATQLQKIGIIIEVFRVSVIAEHSMMQYDSKVLFGKDEPEVHAVARSLSEKLALPKTILFGLGLTEYSAASVADLGNLLASLLSKPLT